MRETLGRFWYAVRFGGEPVLVLAVVSVLHHFGLAGHNPLWLVGGMLLAASAYQLPAVQLALAGGDPRGRLTLRLGLHLALTTAVMYLLGWGALLSVAHLHVMSMHVRMSGARAWRPAAIFSIAGIVCGQLAVQLGWIQNYLPLPEGHAVGALIVIGTATTCRVIGQFAEQRANAEAAVRQREEWFRILVQDASDIITVSDGGGAMSFVSQTAYQITGFPPERLAGRGYIDLVHPDDLASASAQYARALATNAAAEVCLEMRVRHADGGWRWHEVTLRNLLDHPAVRGIVGHHRDVTERRQMLDKASYDAAHDALTGLVNKTAFQAAVAQSLAAAGTDDRRTGLLFIDLDGFKQVNDSFGHEVGDRLLSAVGKIIRSNTYAGDVVGRIGGDEFGVLLAGVDEPGDALAVACRIIAAIDQELLIDGCPVRVGASVGAVVAEPGSADADELLRQADAAMYRTKRRQRSGCELYRTVATTAVSPR